MMEIHMSGSTQIMGNLNNLGAAIRGKLLKRALLAAAAPIEGAAKSFCPRGEGILADSIDTRFTTKGGNGVGFYARVIIGPRRGIRVPVEVMTRGQHAGQVRIAVPTRYAHLVEFGHRLVTHAIWGYDKNAKDTRRSKFGRMRPLAQGGRVIGFVGPRAFMRPAWDTFGGDKALTVFTVNLEAGIVEELSKLTP